MGYSRGGVFQMRLVSSNACVETRTAFEKIHMSLP